MRNAPDQTPGSVAAAKKYQRTERQKIGFGVWHFALSKDHTMEIHADTFAIALRMFLNNHPDATIYGWALTSQAAIEQLERTRRVARL